MTGPAIRRLACCIALPASLAWAEPRDVPAAGDPERDLERLLAINEGELEFLPDGPADASWLKIETDLRIRPESLDDGWVALHQCQLGLDPMSVAEIQYRYRAMRGLRITEQRGMDRAWVEGGSVQLRGIGTDARLCVAMEVQLLRAEGDRFRIAIGPYHRRFLDGYFPVHLQLSVEYPAEHLRWQALQPAPQPGLRLGAQDGRVSIDAQFQGRLSLELLFGPAH